MNSARRIEIAGLTCRLGEVTALDDVSLTIPAGVLFGLVGPNGAGKTTLLRAIAGAIGPAAGGVLIDGRDPGSTPVQDLARLMAVLPQRPVAPVGVTVRETVGWGRGPHLGRLSRPGPDDLRVIDEALTDTDTLELADRPIDALSGGEHHRVLIARALAQGPRILLLDEPTVHLDIGHQVDVMDLLLRLAGRGLTIVAALHDLNLAAASCDSLALLSAGRVLACGEPAEVLRPDLIRLAYGAAVTVRVNPSSGRPYLIVAGKAGSAASGPRLHVICGGGTGAEILARCVEAGYRVSVGVVHVMDTDEEAARALGLEVIEEAPFSPVRHETAAAATAAALASDVVLVTPIPVGPGNLRNLEVAESALAAGIPVILVDGIAQRDFTGGAAAAAAVRLAAGGARVVPNVQTALLTLRRLAPPGRGAREG
ncbi:MAG: ABC transporter ATP-binding protein [Armatimonadota bacterium]